jgi:phytoene synthase
MSSAAPSGWLPGRPVSQPPSVALKEARATTRRVARTFAVACRLLPRAVRHDVYLLYHVFRTLDDLVDEGHPDARARVDAVAAWAAEQPDAWTPEVGLLEVVAARHPVPRHAVSDFCAGMRQDLARETFATEADVDRYCYRVAGTVGLVMAAVLGTRDGKRARPAAVTLGIAMQRTNMLRDIDEDLAAGRVFVAQEAGDRHGALRPGQRAALLREQIAYADRLYERGLAGVGELHRGRWAIAAAGAMYREILREIERGGYGATAGRASVAPARKLTLAARAALRP